jgi:tetratricopeptide (TPR) repeat protein
MFNCNEMLIAQQLNTPKDFQKIIAVSKINYGFQQTNNYQIRQPILEKSPFQASVYTIDGQRKLQKFLKKGNKYFAAKKWDKALKCYQGILKIDANNAWTLHQIAIIYKNKKNLKSALDFYDNLLIIDKLDFEAYWKSAMIYYEQGKSQKAHLYITKAHLLNRNHPEILKDLKKIYFDLGLSYQDNWKFEFGYSFRTVGKDSVLIKSKNELTKAYAICKAVWKYNETYRNAKLVDYGDKLAIIEAKECLLNWLIAHEFNESSKQKPPTDIQLFLKALAQKQENAFIIYEIWAVQNPLIFHTLEEADFEKVMQYLLDIRCEKVKN